jgi:excisionase family DNA binding protein
MDVTPLAFSLTDAARRAGIGRTLLYEAINRGDLRVKKMGRRSLVLADDLRAWLASLPEAKNSRSAAA